MFQGKPKPCRWCAHFKAWQPVKTVGGYTPSPNCICGRESYITVQANPEVGCVHWMRETGADDDLLDNPPNPIYRLSASYLGGEAKP